MPAELDFRTLRGQVEAATRMPDFALLTKRARRLRRRDRLAVTGALIGTLAVLSPITLIAVHARSADTASMPGRPDANSAPIVQPTWTGASTTITTTVLAAAGSRKDGVFTTLDACFPTGGCNLQVALGNRIIAADLVRSAPADLISEVQLTSLDAHTVLLSAIDVTVGEPVAERITSTGSNTVTAPPGIDPLAAGDRPVQLAEHEQIYGIRHSDGSLSRLAAQPELVTPLVDGQVPAGHTWWVSGFDPATSEAAVAVSQDQGVTWTERSLGVKDPLDVPTVASRDGTTAYAFTRSLQGLRQFRSDDAGENWTELPRITLPDELSADGALAGRSFGALVLSDGTILLWIGDTAGTAPIYLQSIDSGLTYQLHGGPAGALSTVGDVYVALTDPPAVSTNCVNWVPEPLPAPVKPR